MSHSAMRSVIVFVTCLVSSGPASAASLDSLAWRVVFENPEHDFPQRVIYWQDRSGVLKARTEGTLNGKSESEEWTWTPIRLGRP